MAHIKIEITWHDKRPKGKPTEETTIWPTVPDTAEEAERFRAAVHEYIDDEYGEQPRTISWDGPFGAAQDDR